MPARTDHDRRDAQHAARATISIAINRYVRRITEEAYAHIEERAASDIDGEIDWSDEGRMAATRALASYGVIRPDPAIDGDAQAALDAGADPVAAGESAGVRS